MLHIDAISEACFLMRSSVVCQPSSQGSTPAKGACRRFSRLHQDLSAATRRAGLTEVEGRGQTPCSTLLEALDIVEVLRAGQASNFRRSCKHGRSTRRQNRWQTSRHLPGPALHRAAAGGWGRGAAAGAPSWCRRCRWHSHHSPCGWAPPRSTAGCLQVTLTSACLACPSRTHMQGGSCMLLHRRLAAPAARSAPRRCTASGTRRCAHPSAAGCQTPCAHGSRGLPTHSLSLQAEVTILRPRA